MQQDEQARKMTPPQLAAVTAVGMSAVAFGLKLALGRYGGVISVWAAAWHAVAGLLYALLLLGILYTPDQPEGEQDLSEAEREYQQYQQGLQLNIKRYEAVLALVGSGMLLAMSYYIFIRVLGWRQPHAGGVLGTLLGLGAVVVAMQFLAQFTYRIGSEHNAPGLVATSFHARTDAFATGLAALAVVTVAMGFRFERFIAALIGLLLVADAAQLFVDATRRLVGIEEEGPTAQLPFWVRLRDALRGYAEQMPPLIRWLLRYEEAMTPAEVRQARTVASGVVLALYLLSGFKTVQPGELGAVKMLGSYWGHTGPGPIYALWPFASVRLAPVDRVQRVTVGFKIVRAWAPHDEDRPVGEFRWQHNDPGATKLLAVNADETKFMLGDTTLVETHVALTYHVRHDKVRRYLFWVEDPQKLVQRATRQAVQELMGTRGLDEVVVEKRGELEREAERLVQAAVDPFDLGIIVERCMIRSVHPPVEVLDAFVDVASALEEQERDRYQAEAYARMTNETAEGERARLTNGAQADRAGRLSAAQGQTSEFSQVYAAASLDPEAVRTRLAIETMERVLSGKEKVILPRGQGRTKLWFGSQKPAALPMVPTPTGEQSAPPPNPENEGGGDTAAGGEGEAGGGNAGGGGG